jgi:hypothetical protein
VDFKKRARLALEAAWASRSEAVADDARTAGLTRGGGLR